KNLYNAWKTISVLRDSVTVKRIKLQFLRQNLKLISILKGQMTYLEECGLLDRELSSSLAGAIEALEASTLRLPIVGGARADIQNMKDAICSAVDVMQAMASSICSSLSKVVEVNNLAADLAKVTRQEQALLDQCKDLLSTLAAMQVKESSLRTYILQLKRVPTSLTTQL
ncbi:Qwrf motif-containing protein, partial [Thalictrum thalictroides]